MQGKRKRRKKKAIIEVSQLPEQFRDPLVF